MDVRNFSTFLQQHSFFNIFGVKGDHSRDFIVPFTVWNTMQPLLPAAVELFSVHLEITKPWQIFLLPFFSYPLAFLNKVHNPF